jgi:hypothetical protein
VLRSYTVRSQLPSDITLIDAVLATCAAHPDFTPVSCGADHDKREYTAVGLGRINPTRDVVTESLELFGGNSSVALLLSLGAGKSGAIPVPLDDRVDPQAFMRAMMNDCDERAQEIERQIGGVGVYFRFSVEQGMQNNPPGAYLGWITQAIGSLTSFGRSIEQGMQNHHIGEVADPSWIQTQADVYLSDHGTSKNIDGLLKNFKVATNCITLEQLGMLPPSPGYYFSSFRRIRRWCKRGSPVKCNAGDDIGCCKYASFYPRLWRHTRI